MERGQRTAAGEERQPSERAAPKGNKTFIQKRGQLHPGLVSFCPCSPGPAGATCRASHPARPCGTWRRGWPRGSEPRRPGGPGGGPRAARPRGRSPAEGGRSGRAGGRHGQGGTRCSRWPRRPGTCSRRGGSWSTPGMHLRRGLPGSGCRSVGGSRAGTDVGRRRGSCCTLQRDGAGMWGCQEPGVLSPAAQRCGEGCAHPRTPPARPA